MDKSIEKKKIGILGIGAIGTVISCALNEIGLHQLFYYNRTDKAHLQLTFERSSFNLPVNVRTTIDNPTELDWLIICLKEHQFANAKNWFDQLITANTKVAVIRNGLRHKVPLLPFTNEDMILECQIDCPVQHQKNGGYKQLKKPVIVAKKDPLATEFSTLFPNHVQVKQVEDFKSESWKKLCESAALGAILCLTGETCHIFKDENMKALYQKLLREMILVARKDGAIIEKGFIEKMIMKLAGYPPDKGSSMLTDRQNGKPIEIGAKNGVIAELARQYGIHTPINDLMVELLKPINKA